MAELLAAIEVMALPVPRRDEPGAVHGELVDRRGEVATQAAAFIGCVIDEIEGRARPGARREAVRRWRALVEEMGLDRIDPREIE